MSPASLAPVPVAPRRRGFTLLEVLIAMALLLVGAVSCNFVIGLLLYGAGGPDAPRRLPLDRARNVGIFLLSAALLAVARSRLPAARKVEAGLVFHILGAAVMSSDDVVHRCYRDPTLVAQVRERFGDTVVSSDGSVDRVALVRWCSTMRLPVAPLNV